MVVDPRLDGEGGSLRLEWLGDRQAAGAERGDQGDHERPDPEGSVDGHRWAAGHGPTDAFVTPVTTRIASDEAHEQDVALLAEVEAGVEVLAGEDDDCQLAGGGECVRATTPPGRATTARTTRPPPRRRGSRRPARPSR